MNNEILEVDGPQATQIIDTGKPLGKYWTKSNGLYIAIDNSCGDSWVEEFEQKSKMMEWLNTNI